MACVEKNGEALRYASGRLQADMEVVRVAVRTAPAAVRFAKGNLLGHKDLCVAVASVGAPGVKQLSSTLCVAVATKAPGAKRLSTTGLQPAAKHARLAQSGLLALTDAPAGGRCEHNKKKSQCALCTPCDCSASLENSLKRRRDLCPDCCPCECTADLPVGQRIRRLRCPDCSPCQCTEDKPVGQRNLKYTCKKCKSQ